MVWKAVIASWLCHTHANDKHVIDHGKHTEAVELRTGYGNHLFRKIYGLGILALLSLPNLECNNYLTFHSRKVGIRPASPKIGKKAATIFQN